MGILISAVWIVTALGAYFLSERMGKKLIPVLHRLKFGQTIRDEGPAWHKNKQGTPTMGGIIFIGAMLIVVLVVMLICQLFLPQKVVTDADTVSTVTRLFAGIVMAIGFGVIGFLDDFIKVVKKRNLGLTSRQKLLGQILLSGAYAIAVYATGGAQIHIPFYGMWFAGIWYIPITVFIIVAMTNATNLTDGVDGLCGSVSVIVCLFLLILCGDRLGYGIVTAATAGALAGFLVWNFHPARVFMGDTGSLFIGGVLCAVAFGIGRPLLLLPMGIVYVMETLSVVLQVSYFKWTHGKRLFKMSPLHHHFELCGWSENKIVLAAAMTTVIGCVIGLTVTVLA
ncbi:MAG: phospho-N-acetylmuramoyl-pentapeptide-transferase [Clostridia bacterium]|nr:phospho-N-acetylmuramoyl-pentapeptide-transferase [Clostridia bacterium]